MPRIDGTTLPALPSQGIVYAVLTVLLVISSILESEPFIACGISTVFIFPCENHRYDDLVIYVTLGGR